MSALARAAGFRHGIVLPPQRVPRCASDPAGFVNVAVPSPAGTSWKTAAGGIGRTAAAADAAALGEALERYAASACSLPELRREEVQGDVIGLEDFTAYAEVVPRAAAEATTYTPVHSARDNGETWVPAELVALRPGSLGVTTSSGLAAAQTRVSALLRAVRELVERDALAVTWAHGVAGRRVALAESYESPVRELGGDVFCIDATPAYSPHPVAIVAGRIPLRGRPRCSLGAACSASWGAAVEKAYLEWLQGIAFAGTYCALNPHALPLHADDVRTFDDHAVFYTANPGRWDEVPIGKGELVHAPAPRAVGDPAHELEELVFALHDAGIRVLYRELTTCDLRQLGVSVVRALSPELAPIWSDHRRRFLAGPARDLSSRYAWALDQSLCFPTTFPHPLG